jgi:hypothetical protein
MGPAGKCHFGISTLSTTCTTPLDCMTPASARVRMGLIPLEMQEKCFLYYAGETLHLHRSWTGSRIARVHFAPDGDGLRATSAEVNREPQQYTATDDAADIDLIERLVRELGASQQYLAERRTATCGR